MEGSPQPPQPPQQPQPPGVPVPVAQSPQTPQPPQAPQPPVSKHGQQRHAYNEEQDVASRPCQSCGGQMEFNIAQQALVCAHCGSNKEIVHAPDAAVEEQSYAMLGVRAASGELNTHLEGEKEIICQNCGGHTTFVGTTTSTRCPYCATPIQRTDIHEAPDRLAVDGVLPFQVTDERARELLQSWVKKRWFAPNEFKKYSSAGSFESVYAAYFTYDAFATTRYQGSRGDDYTVTVGHGENRRTETRTDWNRVSGTVQDSFDDITVLGNTGFNDKFVGELEPWPTQGIQPFSPDYISGHLCRTYDRDVEDCYRVARQRMDAVIEQTIKRDIGGDHQRIDHRQTNLQGLTYKHVLLPIWLLTVLYQGEPLQVFMNGVTGEVHGERPWSKLKIALAVIAVVLALVLLITLVSLGRSN